MTWVMVYAALGCLTAAGARIRRPSSLALAATLWPLLWLAIAGLVAFAALAWAEERLWRGAR